MKKFSLIILLFSTLFFPIYTQVYQVPDASLLSSRYEVLSTSWEFFPNTFIDPTKIYQDSDYNLGLASNINENTTISGSIVDLEIFNKENFSEKLNTLKSSNYSNNSILVELPSSWNSYRLGEPFSNGSGSGSYRLLVKGLDPSKLYSFCVFDLFSNAYSIYVNGKLITTVGKPDVDYTKTVPDISMDIVSFVSNEKGEANFVLHISNLIHRNGGAWNAIKFAEDSYVHSRYKVQLNYAFLCFGTLLTIFLYQMFLFLFKKMDFGSLYLALFAIVILIRLIVTPISLIEYFFPNISYSLSLKLEYEALILGPMLFLLYTQIKMKKILHKNVVTIACIFGVILSILVFSSNAYIANRFVPVIQSYTVITCIYIFIMMILSFLRKKNLEIGLMVFAAIFTIVAAIHDIAVITNINIIFPSSSLISYAFITFVFIQTLIIARQQEKSHKSILRLTTSLSKANENYSRFMPKEVISLLKKKSLADIVPGEWISQNVTLLCFDIKQFTTWAENTEARDIFLLLNRVLNKISPIVRENGGFIEKYLGDGIIAIFPDNGLLAFETAIEIQEALVELRKDLKAENLPEISGGCGIHYGKIVLGTVGNLERLNQITVSKDIKTVIKLESLTRICNSNIVASRSAFERWVPNNKYVTELLHEEITFQQEILENAYAIKSRITN